MHGTRLLHEKDTLIIFYWDIYSCGFNEWLSLHVRQDRLTNPLGLYLYQLQLEPGNLIALIRPMVSVSVEPMIAINGLDLRTVIAEMIQLSNHQFEIILPRTHLLLSLDIKTDFGVLWL